MQEVIFYRWRNRISHYLKPSDYPFKVFITLKRYKISNWFHSKQTKKKEINIKIPKIVKLRTLQNLNFELQY